MNPKIPVLGVIGAFAVVILIIAYSGTSIIDDTSSEVRIGTSGGMPTLIPNKYVEGYINNIIGAKYPLIDLRSVCYDDECFANPIEPSEYGGDKITDEIINKVLDN